MNKNHCKQENIRLGTHGEDYGSWMSNPVFYIIGGIGVLAAVLAVLSFYVLHVAVLGVLFTVITIALLVLLIWITWIRRQYAFGGGGIQPCLLHHWRNHGTGSSSRSLSSGL